MIDRSKPAAVVLVAVALVGTASGDLGLLLGLTPALALLIPLIAGLFPGEGAIAAAVRWLDSVRYRGHARPRPASLDFITAMSPSGLAGLGFGTRGPPASALTI
jgi:hypothetical protein